MRRPLATITALVASCLAAREAAAQTPPAAKPTITVGDFELAPEMEVRTRGEYRRNPVDMGGAGSGYYAEDPWAIMERARVGLAADRGPLRAKITFQDARVWGSTPPTAIFNQDQFASTGLYEAFAEVHTTSPAPNPTYLRVGRQAIVWDGGRLLGNADFSPVARTLDAVRGHIGHKALDLEAFAAIVDTPRPIGIGFADSTGPYRGGGQLYGALASYTFDPLLKLQAYGLFRPAPGVTGSTFITDEFQLARVLGDTWTAALAVSGDAKGWKYGVTGALQLGTVPLTIPLDRLAYAVAGDVSRNFDGIVLSPTVKLGAAYASGQQDASHYGQFDPLYPDVQVYHGLLGAFAWSNIIDAHGSVSVVPTTDMTVTAEYRYARLASAAGEWLDTYLVSAGHGSSGGEELGHEIDLMASYRPWPALTLAAGYSMLILGDAAKSMMAAEQRGSANSSGTLVPPDLSHYAFLQLTLNVPATP